MFYPHEKSQVDGPNIVNIYGNVVNMHGNYSTCTGHLSGKNKVIVNGFRDYVESSFKPLQKCTLSSDLILYKFFTSVILTR